MRHSDTIYEELQQLHREFDSLWEEVVDLKNQIDQKTTEHTLAIASEYEKSATE